MKYEVGEREINSKVSARVFGKGLLESHHLLQEAYSQKLDLFAILRGVP